MANLTGGLTGHVTGGHNTPSQVILQDCGISSGQSYQERGAVLILHTSLSDFPWHGLEQQLRAIILKINQGMNVEVFRE